MTTRLLGNEQLGAGNAFPLACADEELARSVVLELDRSYTDHEGRLHDSLTLPQLDRITDALAAGYWRDGIRPKDPVAVFLEESVRYLVHYVALNKIGAIPVLLNSLMPSDLGQKFITRVGAVAVVSDRTRIPTGFEGPRFYENDPFGEGEFRRFVHTENDPVLIAHTSGTTGVPKAVQFNHGGFFFGIRQQIGADLGERILSVLPQSHGSAISVLMSAVVRGSKVLLATQRGASALADSIERFRPNLVAAFPKTFVDLCRLDLDARDFDSVARWMCTGDANHEQHIRKLVRQGTHIDREGRKQSGSLFIDNFGSSEFGFAMFRTIHTPTSNRYGRCIGRPFGWIDVELFDDNDEPVGPRTVGRLALKSPTVTSGYWNNTLLSEKNRVRGYWLTGDVAYRDEDGLYYHMDRTVDYITTGDGAVYSAQCEELILARFPEVFDCSLVAVAQASEGTEAPLVLTADLAEQAVDTEDLLQRINEALGEKGLPKIRTIRTEGLGEHVGLTGKSLKRTMRDALADQV
ncbi:acyl--CoA ligase [Streptomyces sp. NA04227]|uniref:class I adenylate-forming enzyme family protein n=1 Tax=Streptomyces sp. NA04227 TaxID=2742136 RepID=UPI001591F10B|nr:class I adenylate-forming enzyme family protein [Streptomyces sp. NA04227]QKW10041.1 acyl--CoA ligase [Streptomyces sp. NA04227]